MKNLLLNQALRFLYLPNYYYLKNNANYPNDKEIAMEFDVLEIINQL